MNFFSSLRGRPTFEELPLLPLRELVMFPNTMMSVYITHKEGIKAIEEALRRDLRLFAACVKGFALETYDVGSVVRIMQHLKMPDKTFRVVLHGEYRAFISESVKQDDFSIAKVKPIVSLKASVTNSETLALMRAVQKSFAQYAEYSKKINSDTLLAAEKTENFERLANLVNHSLQIKPDRKIDLLSTINSVERLQKTLEALELENEIYSIQKNISGKVKSRMEKNQREYILNEQIKEINKELGKEDKAEEFAEIEQAIIARNPSEEVLLKAQKELARLRKLQPFTPEAGVLRGYLEWISDLPWSGFSDDSGNLTEAECILNEDHFGMHKAKERIIEFIAVRKLLSLKHKEEEDDSPIKGPILCFVGPPGTGKTSLGKSVARALGRRFVRISLGGIRDEAEIRGHRKTYVGALPGKIIQSMRKAGTINPVFLLDEIDKLSHDFRGDPASALLEVLDPEQNSTFVDHYLEVPYNLSQVLFIATANSLHTIPYPLLDRMEILEIPGYGENEKLSIAQEFLIPKEISENGFYSDSIKFQDEAVREIIRHWTMESGVRSLEREIARCIRRIAKNAVQEEFGEDPEKPVITFNRVVEKSDLEKLLGKHKYKKDVFFSTAKVGVSYGLAWTESGGIMLPVESIIFDGSGELIITGNLGDVMKESARIALSYLRSVRDKYNFIIPSEDADVSKLNFHIHVPEGAIPKDGPSAGVALASSMLSTLCQIAPKPNISMTGELTLTGRVLPIGGLKEKLLAAIRNEMDLVLLPFANKEDWEELDEDIRSAIQISFLENAEDAFNLIFGDKILRKSAGRRRKKSDNLEK